MIHDRIMGSCKDATQLLSKSLDTRLGVFDRLRLKLHFRVCTYCRRFEDQLHRLHAAGRQYDSDCGELTSFEGLPPEARKRIKHALRCEEPLASPRPPGEG